MKRDITVKGRGIFVAESRPIAHGVIIRIDDYQNLAFWAEIVLPIPLLKFLIEDAERYTEENNN